MDRWQQPECISIEQLRQALAKSQVDRLLSALGLDATLDVLVECGRTPRPAAAGITPKTEPRKPDSPSDSLSLTTVHLESFSSRISGCADRVAAYPFSLAGAGNRGPKQWIDDTVAQVDTDLASCRDSGNSQIATDPNEKKVKGVHDLSTPPPPQLNTDVSLDENSALLVKTEHDGSSGGTGASRDSTTGWAKSETGEDLDEKGTGKSKTGWDPIGWIISLFGSSETPCREGADCAPSCEEKNARWQRFKDSCEQSRWQAYPCVAFLRKVNGCVDASLINPGPDGDLTCPVKDRATPAQRMPN